MNDDYVAQAWAKAAGVSQVHVLADGNGAFITGLQALAVKENVGMGGRAWRLALVVNANGMVEWAGIEEGQRPNATDNLYEESTPAKLLAGLAGLKAAETDSSEADANWQAALQELSVGG